MLERPAKLRMQKNQKTITLTQNLTVPQGTPGQPGYQVSHVWISYVEHGLVIGLWGGLEIEGGPEGGLMGRGRGQGGRLTSACLWHMWLLKKWDSGFGMQKNVFSHFNIWVNFYESVCVVHCLAARVRQQGNEHSLHSFDYFAPRFTYGINSNLKWAAYYVYQEATKHKKYWLEMFQFDILLILMNLLWVI